ncbi:hypothetical protein BGZ67_000676 [Mortierella alpina]|nr:hypothetical protein BGZ67_000676 [Mortierella alpina]
MPPPQKQAGSFRTLYPQEFPMEVYPQRDPSSIRGFVTPITRVREALSIVPPNLVIKVDSVPNPPRRVNDVAAFNLKSIDEQASEKLVGVGLSSQNIRKHA